MENHEDFCRKCREELGETPSTLLDPARHLGWSLGRVVTKSSVRFCGRPILPPLLGLEQKAEMRELLATALEKSTRKIGASAQKRHAHTNTSSNNPQSQARDRAANDSRIDSSIERERRDEVGSCRGDDDDDGRRRHHHQHRSSSDVSRHHAVSPASSFDLTRTVSASSRHHLPWLHLDDDDDDDDGDDEEEEEENSSTAVVTVGSPHDELGALGVPHSGLDADRFRTAGEKSAMQGDDVGGGDGDGDGGGGDGDGGGGDGGGGDGCRPPGEPSAGVYTEMAARSDSPSLSVAELVVDDGSGGVSGGSGGSGVTGSGGGGGSSVISSGVSGGSGVIGSGSGGGSGVSGVIGGSDGSGVIGSGGGGVTGGSGVIGSGSGGGSGGGSGVSGVSGGSGGSDGSGVIGSGGVTGGSGVTGSGSGGGSGGGSGVSGVSGVMGSGGSGVMGSGVSGGIDVIGSGGVGGVSSAAGGNLIDGGSDGDRGVGGDDGSGGGSGGGGGGFLPASASTALFAEGEREPACRGDDGGSDDGGADDGGADEWSEVARLLEAQALMLMERTSPLGQGGGGELRAEITSGGGGGGRWGGIGRLMGEGIYWGEGQMVGEERRRGGVGEGTSGGEAAAEGRALERMLEMRREGTSAAFEGTFGLGEGLRGLEVHGGRNRDAGIVDGRREQGGRSGGSQADRRTRSEGGGFGGGGGGGAGGMFAECLGVVAGRPSLPSAFPPCAWLSERSFERSPRARDAAPCSGVEAAASRPDSEQNRAARAAPLNRSYDVATPSPALLASLRAGGEEVERELVKRCLETELLGVMGVRAKVTCGSYWRAMKDDSRLKGERVTALARGFLARRLLATEKVQQLKQTVKDTRDLLRSLSQATPPRRSRSTQDSALYERALAQLRAALYDVHDIFFATTSHEKVEMMRSDRETRREREQRRLERSVEVPHGRPVLSAATQKSLERKFKQRATEQNRGSPRTRGPIVRASSHSRVFRPNQSINTLPPAAMATGGLYRSAIAKGKEAAFPASAASPTASHCARVRKIGGGGGGGGTRKVGSIAIKKRPSLAM
ncbi:uncharacterized protein LOC144950152 [Lampetra fluviatilis]